MRVFLFYSASVKYQQPKSEPVYSYCNSEPGTANSSSQYLKSRDEVQGKASGDHLSNFEKFTQEIGEPSQQRCAFLE